jgi:transcriptional regulator with XRE-family HTH domain
MKLLEYRKKEKKTQKEMAALLGVSLIVYCSWEYGLRYPTRNNMKNIVEKTNGEVQPNDFYEGDNNGRANL